MATSTATTSSVYLHVIEDVINKVRKEFINDGGRGESLLNELQGIWEMKIMQAGVLRGPIEESSAQNPTPGGPVTHDLNVPYEGTDEYETPTADMIFPPTPLQTPLPAPLSATAHNSNQLLTQDFFVSTSRKRKRDELSARYPNGESIPQQDRASDAISKIYKFQGNDEEQLNEGDDDEDSDDEMTIPHVVVAQFDKVSRSKNKWKCTLSGGIMHTNDKDILFNKVTGAFEF